MGLDYCVWLTMLIAILISAFTFSFKVITHINCTDFEITATGVRQQANNIFYIGETISFSAAVPSQSSLNWNFGDGTPMSQSKNLIPHSFLKEGKFTVACTINGKCTEIAIIYVIPTPPKSGPTNEPLVATDIIGADTIYAGGIGHFTSPIKANYSYQWSIATSPDIPVQTTATADFTFYKEGKQTLQLKIDGTKYYSKIITVLRKKTSTSNVTPGSSTPVIAEPIHIPPAINFIVPSSGGPETKVTISGSFFTGLKFVSIGGIPAKVISVSSTQIVAEVGDGASGAVVVTTENGSFTFANPPFTYIPPKAPTPEPPETEKSKIVGITDKQFKQMLGQVVNGTMHAADFDRYLCKGVNTKVYVNNAKTTVSFGELCEKQLQGKKVEVESAHIVPDPYDPNCQANLVVKYKKKGIWPFN